MAERQTGLTPTTSAGAPARSSDHGEVRIPERPGIWGSLGYRDFRLLWFGLIVCQVGFWMQFTSMTYLVGIVLANSAAQSALNLGLLGAARSLPVFLCAPIAGYVADRYPRRRTLIITNLAQAVLGLVLAFVAQGHGPWVLPAVLFISGVFAGIQSFDYSARGSWVTFLVPRHLISNAIGLTSFGLNVPLMVGPALAGILISSFSVYASFFFQAATQWAPVVALIFMKPAPVSKVSREGMLPQMIAGVRFIAKHDVLRWLVLTLAVTCICVRPYNWLLAGFAAHVLHVDARGYGTMLAVGGVGTVGGALTTALYQMERRGKLWISSGILTAIGMFVLGQMHSFAISVALLAVMGWATMSFTSSANVMIQMLSPEEMRGRTMALYSMVQNGFVPLGTLLLGSLGALVGLPIAYSAGAFIALTFSIWAWAAHPALRKV